MEIEYLNHSSLILKYNNGLNILFDPWFDGKCFNDGWGLKFNYRVSSRKIKQCNYLWISHYHSDHFHEPTLKKILNINPEIIVLANRSYNIQFDKILCNFGFKNIIPLEERKKLKLDSYNGIEIIRYPTTGIDNMLFISSPEGNILNYNDCNIPAYSKKKLKRQIGEIDLLFNAFNHGGKIMEFPLPSIHEIKKKIKVNFYSTIDIFSPNYTIPFASYHYYRAPESAAQNRSLISSNELITKHHSIISLGVGDNMIYDKNKNKIEIVKTDTINPNIQTLKVRSDSINIKEILKSGEKYLQKINKGFFYLTFWIPSLRIRVDDYNIILKINIFRKSCSIIGKTSDYHITAHSSELFYWFTKPNGTDTFYVGAHFQICKKNIFPLNVLMLLGLLIENRLDLRCLSRMLFSYQGILFYYNRREEIIGILFFRKFMYGIRN